MKSHSQSVIPSGAFIRDHWNVPIRVRLEPYVDFCRRLDEQLEKLVKQWSDQAAPAANRFRR